MNIERSGRGLDRARLLMSIVLALLLVPPGSVSLRAVAASQPADALERFDALEASLDASERALSDRRWYAADVGFELAFETATTITAWLREKIAFEPYRGVLRGADGVLHARAGNAYDQALLLSALLFDAGYDARVARARIDEDQARALIGTIEPHGVWEAPEPGGLEALVATLGGDAEMIARVDEEAHASVAALQEQVAETTTWLIDVLAAQGMHLGSGDLDDLIEVTRDYAWVEYRLGGEGTWSSLHPVAPSDASWPERLEPDEVFVDTIPEELVHTFRVQALIERRRGSDLQVEAVTTAIERPVATLSGVAMSYQAVPDGLADLEPGWSPEELAAATTFLIPFFDDEPAPGDLWFDVMGNTAPAFAAADPAGGVFGGLARGLGGALDEVTGEDDVVALTAHWLEYTFVEPGGVETTHRRMIVDRLGEERRTRGEVSGSLMEMTEAELVARLQTRHTLMLAPGRYDPEYIQRRSLDASRRGLDYLRSAYVMTEADPDMEILPPPPAMLEAARSATMLRLVGALDELPHAASGDVASYRPAPTLLVASEAHDSGRRMLDIVQNRRQVVDVATASVSADPHRAVHAGVWESGVEGLLLGTGEDVFDTLRFFRSVTEAGIEVRAFGPDGIDGIDELAIPSESRQAMRRDVERGYVVVSAATMPEGMIGAAWWRVDTRTGETLGRIGDGRGGVTFEYGTVELFVAGVLIGGVFGIAAFAACLGAGNDVMCCAIDAGAGLVLGALIGVKVGAAAGLIAAASFDGLVTIGSLASLFGVPFPSSCMLIGEAIDGSDVVRVALVAPCSGPVHAESVAREAFARSGRARRDSLTARAGSRPAGRPARNGCWGCRAGGR